MEAGNGYPANDDVGVGAGDASPASMEAGNGYPANASPIAPCPPRPPLQWRPGMVTRQTWPSSVMVNAGTSLQWRPGMVTRQTSARSWSRPRSTPLQWRPGMVTRQTLLRLLIRFRSLDASMEAGNGYPANTPRTHTPAPSSSRFNGGREWLPGKPAGSGYGQPRLAPFNGGREWLPGKQEYRCCWSPDWDPFNGGREWLPGKRHTLERLPATADPFNGGREWLPGKREPDHQGCAVGRVPSMEAGNGYPANYGTDAKGGYVVEDLQWRPGMVTRQTPISKKSPATSVILQWRPGMVTRQTA